MTNRTFAATALIGLILGVAGCESRTTPSSPSTMPSPPSGPPEPRDGLVTFADPHSSFVTSDLHDANEQVVRVSVARELIWLDGTRLPGFSASGNSISVPACACSLVVRFGSRDGERRAYLTADYIHDNPGTLVSLGIADGSLTITRTTLFAPGTHTLSGVITETSETGSLPVEGAGVWRLNDEGSSWQVAISDENGFYELKGLYDGGREVSVIKDGYHTARSAVIIDGDTRFDREIVKR